jgi:hypothetical protein
MENALVSGVECRMQQAQKRENDMEDAEASLAYLCPFVKVDSHDEAVGSTPGKVW